MINVLLQRERPPELGWLAPAERERASAIRVARRREDRHRCCEPTFARAFSSRIDFRISAASGALGTSRR